MSFGTVGCCSFWLNNVKPTYIIEYYEYRVEGFYQSGSL